MTGAIRVIQKRTEKYFNEIELREMRQGDTSVSAGGILGRLMEEVAYELDLRWVGFQQREFQTQGTA